MVNGIRQISLERGYDTRDFALVVGGGCGPAHVGKIARNLGINKVIIPRVASTLCAWGSVIADVRQDFSTMYTAKFHELNLDKLNNSFEEMTKLAHDFLDSAVIPKEDRVILRTMDIRYLGEGHELTISIPIKRITRKALREIEDIFHSEHRRLYAFAIEGATCELLNLGITAVGKHKQLKVEIPSHEVKAGAPLTAKTVERTCIFEELGGRVKTPVFSATKLQIGDTIIGPAIVEEETMTIVVFPGSSMELVSDMVYLMTLEPI